MEYLQYNREERDICAHLFRLLLEDQPNWGPLRAFLNTESVENPRLFCEVALLRDAYYARKQDAESFMTEICGFIAKQQGVSTYTAFGDLPEKVRNPVETHPKQIRFKLAQCGTEITENDKTVYGALQAMFNAKPDPVICEGTTLYVYEAKYTLDFDKEQLSRTEQIAEV